MRRYFCAIYVGTENYKGRKCTYWDTKADLQSKQMPTAKKLRQKVNVNLLHLFQLR